MEKHFLSTLFQVSCSCSGTFISCPCCWHWWPVSRPTSWRTCPMTSSSADASQYWKAFSETRPSRSLKRQSSLAGVQTRGPADLTATSRWAHQAPTTICWHRPSSRNASRTTSSSTRTRSMTKMTKRCRVSSSPVSFAFDFPRPDNKIASINQN